MPFDLISASQDAKYSSKSETLVLRLFLLDVSPPSIVLIICSCEPLLCFPMNTNIHQQPTQSSKCVVSCVNWSHTQTQTLICMSWAVVALQERCCCESKPIKPCQAPWSRCRTNPWLGAYKVLRALRLSDLRLSCKSQDVFGQTRLHEKLQTH